MQVAERHTVIPINVLWSLVGLAGWTFLFIDYILPTDNILLILLSAGVLGLIIVEAISGALGEVVARRATRRRR